MDGCVPACWTAMPHPNPHSCRTPCPSSLICVLGLPTALLITQIPFNQGGWSRNIYFNSLADVQTLIAAVATRFQRPHASHVRACTNQLSLPSLSVCGIHLRLTLCGCGVVRVTFAGFCILWCCHCSFGGDDDFGGFGDDGFGEDAAGGDDVSLLGSAGQSPPYWTPFISLISQLIR